MKPLVELSFTVKKPDMDAILGRGLLERYNANMQAAMWESGMLLVQRIKSDTEFEKSKYIGTLSGSLYVIPPRLESGVEWVGGAGTSLLYAEAVELGTRPHFPPIEPLEAWVIKKLNKEPEEAGAIALAIARKIRWHGTEGKKIFERVYEETAPMIDDIISRAVEKTLNDEAYT